MVSNEKVAEIFANSQAEAKSDNMFIEGGEIYSYGLHFCISRKLNNKIALFTKATYSNTTAKHKNHVRNALESAGWRVIEVNKVKPHSYITKEFENKWLMNELNETLQTNKADTESIMRKRNPELRARMLSEIKEQNDFIKDLIITEAL